MRGNPSLGPYWSTSLFVPAVAGLKPQPPPALHQTAEWHAPERIPGVFGFAGPSGRVRRCRIGAR